MSSYVVSPQADEDIFEIWRYLCQKASLDAANRVEEEIYCGVLSTASTHLEIVRVLHGRRNVKQILTQ